MSREGALFVEIFFKLLDSWEPLLGETMYCTNMGEEEKRCSTSEERIVMLDKRNLCPLARKNLPRYQENLPRLLKNVPNIILRIGPCMRVKPCISLIWGRKKGASEECPACNGVKFALLAKKNCPLFKKFALLIIDNIELCGKQLSHRPDWLPSIMIWNLLWRHQQSAKKIGQPF